jgi:hypothetical protein
MRNRVLLTTLGLIAALSAPVAQKITQGALDN